MSLLGRAFPRARHSRRRLCASRVGAAAAAGVAAFGVSYLLAWVLSGCSTCTFASSSLTFSSLIGVVAALAVLFGEQAG